MLFNETFFGLLLHGKLKGRAAFQYPEERPGYQPEERFMPGYKTRMAAAKDGSSGDDKEAERPPTFKGATDDPYLVDWYGDADSDNPVNWSGKKKALFIGQIMLLSTSVYMGSSIVSPAIPYMVQYWNVSLVVGALSLSLFVFGYGIGPMLGICAASEVPAIGRNIPYVLSLFLFVVLQVPTALVNSVGSFLVLRFLAGLFGSPPLATGGASVQDVFSPYTAPLALSLWGISASAGPVLGPLIGGFASQGFAKTSLGVEAWRWTIWPLLMLTAFTLVFLTLCMPESSATNILARRAARLRIVTGNPHLRSAGELWQASMTGKELVLMIFVRPYRLGLLEPIALSINLHIGLVYGVLYSFFESFTIVFTETHGFNLGETGLSYLGIFIATLIACALVNTWFITVYRPKMVATNNHVAPELWLVPAMFGGICLPLSLFAFGWTSNPDIHWIVPIVASMLFAPAIFGLFASGLCYLSTVYPDYIASVFSANDFTRAAIGAAMPLVSRQMFLNLHNDGGPQQFPVALGCTLLGGVAAVMAVIRLRCTSTARRCVAPHPTLWILRPMSWADGKNSVQKGDEESTTPTSSSTSNEKAAVNVK